MLCRTLPPEARASLSGIQTAGLPRPSPGWVSCSGLMAEGSQRQASLGLLGWASGAPQRPAFIPGVGAGGGLAHVAS